MNRGKRSVRVTVNCVADHYAAPAETIIEFVTADGKLGGLIGFWYDAEAGTLSLHPYRLDDGVTVAVAKSSLADGEPIRCARCEYTDSELAGLQDHVRSYHQ